MNVVAHNIERDPCLPHVPENLLEKVVQLLALDLPLEQAGAVSHPQCPSFLKFLLSLFFLVRERLYTLV